MKPKIIASSTALESGILTDVMFFKIAEGGAMGQPGGVTWVRSNGDSYYLNYCYGEISLEELMNRFQPLKDCRFGIFGMGTVVPKGWQYVNLGMGNHLLVAEQVFKDFKEETREIKRTSELYGKWYNIANKIINQERKQNKMKNNITELVFILDRSGSMAGLEGDTIGGFNSTIEKQKAQDGTVCVSTVLFDNVCEVLHDRVEIQNIEEMTREQYWVRGSTALYDAIGGAIHHIGNVHKYARPEDVPEHTIFVITTDGMENASRRYSGQEIKEKIKRQTEKYGWEFIFLAANIDAAETAESIGIRRERAANYRQTPEGIAQSYDAITRVISDVRCNSAPQMNLEDYLKKHEE